jgi:hypothetical protein
MKSVKNLIIGTRKDGGQDLHHFALVAGLIVIVAVAMMSSAAHKIMMRWHEAVGF